MRKKLPAKVKEGDVFGRWTVISVERVGQYNRATCICECGKSKSVRQDTLLNGQSTSCGCFASEKSGDRLRIDGRSSHRLSDVWYSMNRRCNNPRSKDYKYYGGRGISVCPEWHRNNPNGFWNFVDDMFDSFVEGLEIDRIDNEGNYHKDNCKWSTRSEQVVNSRTLDNKIGEVRWLNDGEETLHLAAMAKKYGLSPAILHDRIGKLGLDLKTAINLPVKVKRYYLNFEGNTYAVSEVFKTPPNVYEVLKREGIHLVDFLYFLFGDNIDVTATKNKELISFPNTHLLQDVKFKIPTINENFVKFLVPKSEEIEV